MKKTEKFEIPVELISCRKVIARSVDDAVSYRNCDPNEPGAIPYGVEVDYEAVLEIEANSHEEALNKETLWLEKLNKTDTDPLDIEMHGIECGICEITDIRVYEEVA